MLLNARNRCVITDSAEIDYITYGRGNKNLVMIPGLNTRDVKGTALFFACRYHIFAKAYTVYVFDVKRNIPEGYTVRNIAADIADAIKALGLTSADVIGISQGGVIAQYLATENPRLVHKLVLGVTWAKENDTLRQAVNRWVRLVENGDYKAFTTDMFERTASTSYMRRYGWLFPVLALFNRPKDAKRFVRRAMACLNCDTYEELDKICCPVLVIGGKQDKAVTGRASEEIAEKIGCELYMYEDLGHLAYEEAEDFNYRVLDFLLETRNCND